MSANVIDSFFVSLGFDINTEKIEEFRKQYDGLRDSILKVGAVFAGAAVGVGAMILKVAEGMDDVGDFADIVGMTAREVDALGKVAKQNDSSFEAMKSTIQGLAQLTGDAAKGIGKGAMAFEQFGFSAKDANGNVKGAYDMLGEVADRMKDMSASERLSLAGKMRIDPSLIPLLSKGSEAFKEMKENAEAANPLTKEMYAQADLIIKAWNKATAGATGYIKLLAAKLFPVMLSILTTYNEWVSAVKKGGGSTIADAFRAAASFAETLWNWIERLAKGVSATYSKMKEFKVVMWAVGAAVAAIIAYEAGVFFITLGGAIMTAAKAIWLFNAGAALPIILLGLIGIAIAAVVDDLVNFYEGNESVIGLLSDDYPWAIGAAWAALVALGGAFIALKWKAIASMLETMAIVAMYAAEWIAAHAAMAVGALVAYWPILLIIAAIAAAVAAVWYLWENWDKVTALLGEAWDMVKTVLSNAFESVMSVFDAAKQKVMGFIDSVVGAITKVGQLLGLTDGNSSVKVAMQSAGDSGGQLAAGSRGPGATGGALGSASTLNNSNTASNQTVNIGETKITINSPDPTKAGESVRSELEKRDRQATRNGQTSVAL